MMRSKNEKGITLVALVITIIILLILAGISISAITNTGIFQSAKEAEQKSEDAKLTEKTRLDEYESEINKYLPTGNGGGEPIPDDGDSDELTVIEKIEKLKNMSAKLAVFDKSVSGTTSDYNSATRDDDLNSLEKATSVEKADCECGKVREIFNKAIEMNLVKDYTDVEIQTITADDGTEEKKEIIIAPIEEESVVLFDFNVYNFEQRPGIVVPAAVSANYEINPNGKEWLDGCKPDFTKGDSENLDKDGGDKENMLVWVNKEYAKNGFVGMQARTTLNGYTDKPVSELGQVVHRKISVLTKTDFVKAMKALNLDLSEYEEKCTHPVK